MQALSIIQSVLPPSFFGRTGRLRPGWRYRLASWCAVGQKRTTRVPPVSWLRPKTPVTRSARVSSSSSRSVSWASKPAGAQVNGVPTGSGFRRVRYRYYRNSATLRGSGPVVTVNRRRNEIVPVRTEETLRPGESGLSVPGQGTPGMPLLREESAWSWVGNKKG